MIEWLSNSLINAKFDENFVSIAVVGLGYIGLPLAVEFSKYFPVLGLDTNESRINSLVSGLDKTGELNKDYLQSAVNLSYTSDRSKLSSANVFVVTVPTPIDVNHQPDLRPLKSASEIIAQHLKPGNVVIYESTVYPGATEEECAPILESVSGLVLNHDFYLGYSPERINPGDKSRSIRSIKKVTSGSTPEAANFVDRLYKKIIDAGTHPVESIKVAEAAKVIENTQRDVNIALINELAIIFDHLGIDTQSVLEAASTKWNFMPFKPGLVGGHCIGIDPYYLTHKAQSSGYHPDVILAGRKINDGMGKYVVNRLIREMIQRRLHINGAKILVMGFAFKENCPDIRNTKVIDIVRGLEDFGAIVDVCDPIVDNEDAHKTYGVELKSTLPTTSDYTALVVAVEHQAFLQLNGEDLRHLLAPNGVLYDLKGVVVREFVDLRL